MDRVEVKTWGSLNRGTPVLTWDTLDFWDPFSTILAKKQRMIHSSDFKNDEITLKHSKQNDFLSKNYKKSYFFETEISKMDKNGHFTWCFG